MQITPYTKWKPAKVKAIRTYKKNRAKKDQIESIAGVDSTISNTPVFKDIKKRYLVCQYCKNENTWAEKKTLSDGSYSGICQVCSCWWAMPMYIIDNIVHSKTKGDL